jgi:hypothetical protein
MFFSFGRLFDAVLAYLVAVREAALAKKDR